MGILAVDVWWFVCIDNTSELCKVQNVYTVIDMPFRMTLYLIWVGGQILHIVLQMVCLH